MSVPALFSCGSAKEGAGRRPPQARTHLGRHVAAPRAAVHGESKVGGEESVCASTPGVAAWGKVLWAERGSDPWCLCWNPAVRELKRAYSPPPLPPASPEIHQLWMSCRSCVWIAIDNVYNMYKTKENIYFFYKYHAALAGYTTPWDSFLCNRSNIPRYLQPC